MRPTSDISHICFSSAGHLTEVGHQQQQQPPRRLRRMDEDDDAVREREAAILKARENISEETLKEYKDIFSFFDRSPIL